MRAAGVCDVRGLCIDDYSISLYSTLTTQIGSLVVAELRNIFTVVTQHSFRLRTGAHQEKIHVINSIENAALDNR